MSCEAPLAAQGVDSLAHDAGRARRIASLERQVGELDGHLGGRLAFVPRAHEQRFGSVDVPRVDVAARQLEVDVGVAHLHLRAGEAPLGLLETALQIVGLGVGRRVALGIEAQAQAHEVELDQLGRDLPLQVARRRRCRIGLDDRLGLLQPSNGEEVGREQARHVAGEDQQIRHRRGARRRPDLEHAEGHHGIGRVAGGAAQEIDPRQEPARQRQIVGRRGGRSGRGDQQAAQLRIVAVVAGHAGRPGRRVGDASGAQVGAGHAGDRPLHLVAVREQELAERAARGVAGRRTMQRRSEALLSRHVERVEPRDDRGRRPIAERALERVDGAPGAVHAAAALVEAALLVGPADHLIEPLSPFVLAGGERRQRRQRQRHLLVGAPRREESDDQLGRRAQQAHLLGRQAGGRRPELDRVEESERVAERGEDCVVDVVALELARLAPDVVRLERQHRIEQVVEQLGPQREPLGCGERQRLEDQPGFEEVILVDDGPDPRGLPGHRLAGARRCRPARMRATGRSPNRQSQG